AAPAPAAPAPDPLPQWQPPTHPDVQEAQSWADNVENRFNQLKAMYDRLQQLRNPDDGQFPADPFNEFLRQYNALNNDLESILEQEAPLWQADSLTNDENAALQDALQRLRNVNGRMSDVEPSNL